MRNEIKMKAQWMRLYVPSHGSATIISSGIALILGSRTEKDGRPMSKPKSQHGQPVPHNFAETRSAG